MSIIEFVTTLTELLPTYYLAPKVDDNNPAPTLPFVCYIPSKEYLIADNTNFHATNSFTLEYYFEIKDPESEILFENKLNDMGYVFSRSEDAQIDDLYVIYYEIN